MCVTGGCYRATIVMSNGDILLYSSAEVFKYVKTLSSTEVSAFVGQLTLTITDKTMQNWPEKDGFGTCCDAYFDGSDEYITFGSGMGGLRVTGRDNAPVALQSMMWIVDTFSTRAENVPNQATPCSTAKPTDKPTEVSTNTVTTVTANPTTTAKPTDKPTEVSTNTVTTVMATPTTVAVSTTKPTEVPQVNPQPEPITTFRAPGTTDLPSCTNEQCGPAPMMPSHLCPDGHTMAGPGPCVRLPNGQCGWESIQCPAADDFSCMNGDISVPVGWAGGGLADNWCNSCSCSKDGLMCTMMGCTRTTASSTPFADTTNTVTTVRDTSTTLTVSTTTASSTTGTGTGGTDPDSDAAAAAAAAAAATTTTPAVAGGSKAHLVIRVVLLVAVVGGVIVHRSKMSGNGRGK